MEQQKPLVPRKYLLTFILITSLFALWGFANDITNPMVAAYQEFTFFCLSLYILTFGLAFLETTANPYTNCGKCASCRNGRVNACQHNETLGVQRDGAMRQWADAPGKVFRILVNFA